MNNNINIGFIGIGNMGFPMVNRLIDNGYKIITSGHSKSKNTIDKINNLRKKGAVIVDNFSDIAKHSQVIITVLPADDELIEVLLDEHFIKNLKEKTKVIDMTSCKSETIIKINEFYKKNNLSIIDAPVSGGVDGAKNGTLSFLTSGDEKEIESVKNILNVLGENFFYVGEVGMGKAMKSVNQLIVGLNMIAISEAFNLAKHIGLDINTMYSIIKKSTGNSNIFERKFNKMVSGDLKDGFKLKLMRKDLKVAIDSAEELPLPFSRLAHDFYLLAKEYDELDFTAINKVLDK